MSQWRTCLECGELFQGVRCSCGWQQKGTPTGIVFRNTEHALPANGVMREEFGLQLFEAIHLIGQIKQLRVMLGRVAMGELKPSDYKQREAKAVEQLRTCLVQLTPDDVVEVTNDYPWVAAL